MKKITTFLLSLMIIVSLHKTHAQICTFAGGECCGEGITNFQLNGTPAINRSSTVNENGGFTNTGITTAVVIGQAYNYSITFPLENNIVNCNTYNLKIYVDYNHNDLLTDAGEEVVSLSDVPNGTHTGSFTIPAATLTGNAYMRVMMKMAATSSSGGNCGHTAITPCNLPADPVGFHGEVENYTLNITASTGIENLEKQNGVTIYPNPFSSETILKTNVNLNNATLTVYNSFGQTVKQIKNINGQTVTLSRDNLASGMYFIRLTQDNQVIATKKLIITD